MVTQPPSDVFTLEQTAEYLQFGVEKVQHLIHSGQLIASEIDGEVRIRKQNIELLLAKTRVRQAVGVRLYTDEEIAQFLKEDELDAETLEFVQQFTRMMDSNDQR